MSSSSSKAQQKLAELEKAEAPFDEQLIEASKYIGLDISNQQTTKDDDSSKLFHGKEDWVLRWLLKKLQSSDGTSARLTPRSWRLLYHVIRSIPISSAARLLNERKFMTILSKTLDEAKQHSNTQVSEVTPNSNSETSSRKRKRSGELVITVTESSILELMEAIVTTLSYLGSPPKPSTTDFNTSQSTLATVELVKSVLRTTADEAARILGSWLSLCRNDLPTPNACLDPFIEIWESRKLGIDDMTEFSQHCTEQLLLLLKLSSSDLSPNLRIFKRNRAWKPKLEELLARNVILPAKASPELRTKLMHVENPVLAPFVLEISIRSIQSRENRRRLQDTLWLQEIFADLKSVMSSGDADDSLGALGAMIRIANDHHLKLEPSVLRSILVEYAFGEHLTDWSLIAAILESDANVFLDESELLQQLLSRITWLSLQEEWVDVSDMITEKIIVLLMKEFAKSRKLVIFMHHWHAQMKEFVRKRQGESTERLCAWKDLVLQEALAEVMETSLTTNQLVEVIDWLDDQLKIDEQASVVAACVLLEAIAESIHNEETVDLLRLRFSDMLSTENVTKNLRDSDYSHLRWCILTSIIRYSPYPAEDAIAVWRTWSSALKTSFDKDNLESGESYQSIVCISTLWDAIDLRYVEAKEDKLSMEELLIKFLRAMDLFFATLAKDVRDQSLPIYRHSSTINARLFVRKVISTTGYGAILLSKCHSILELIPRVESTEQNLLQNVLRIASIPTHHSVWDEVSRMWKDLVNNDKVQNNREVFSQLIKVMLQYTTIENPSRAGLPYCNLFVAKCLSAIPLELLGGSHNKKYRVAILKAWTPNTVSRGYLDPAIWSLKLRILQYPTFYEGMSFYELTNVARTFHHIRLEDSQLENPQLARISTLVPVFGEIVKRTLSHVLPIADQAKGKEYLQEVARFLKDQSKQVKSFVDRESCDKPIWDHIGIKLVDATLQALTGKAALHDHGILDERRLGKIKTSFKKVLISDLAILFDLEESDHLEDQDDHDLFLSCIMDALKSLEITDDDLAPVKDDAVSCLERIDHLGTAFGKRLRGFLLVHPPAEADFSLTGDVSTVVGGLAIKELAKKRLAEIYSKSQNTTEQSEEDHKRIRSEQLRIAYETAKSVVENTDEEHRVAKLLELGYIVAGCEDLRAYPEPGRHVPTIADVYNILCQVLSTPKGIREFCLASEIMSSILRRTKHQRYSISQHNIDCTLSAIASICSRHGPSLPPHSASAIFTRLCDLLQAILSSHRVAIDGHFHALLQPMQALMRCLFTPLPHKSSKSIQSNPRWLPSQLNQASFPAVKHASQFSQLITLICDPSSSAVSHPNTTNNLTSSKNEAKRYASEHMIHLLTLYINLQLDMKMAPELHDSLKPAVWSIFSITDKRARARVVDELDSRGKIVWGRLFREWERSERWSGN